MKFIDKLERKFGNRGIENLTIYIIVSYVLGYALMYINPGALSMLSLNVSEILHGQIWRLVTWIIYPPSTSSALWFVIAILFFYYPICDQCQDQVDRIITECSVICRQDYVLSVCGIYTECLVYQ